MTYTDRLYPVLTICGFEEIRGRYAQGICQAINVEDGDVPLSSLNATQVASS